MPNNSDIDPISAKLQSEEQRRLRWTLLFTLIPLLAAVALIWVSAIKVEELDDTLDALKAAEDSLLLVNEQRIEQLYAVNSLELAKDSLFTALNAMDSSLAQRTEQQAKAAFLTLQQVPRVYMHIMDERQRDKAQQLQKQLEKSGYNVPGIELVSSRSQDSDLRVFREADLTTADNILEVANTFGAALTLHDLSSRYENSTAIRPGHFEIWLGTDFGR